MIYNSQFDYDNAAEPELDDYRESPEFAEFAEYVALELLAGRDWQNLSSDILRIDLEQAGGGYIMANDWVRYKVTEKQYRAWLNG